jgi:DNA-binding NarL/FixJ family response regulator
MHPENFCAKLKVNSSISNKNHNGKKMRILLVDSQPKLRYALRLMLERQKEFEIIGEAANDIEAARMAHALNPDIVLMEVKFPEFDGLEVAHRIKSEQMAKEVIVLTIRDSAEFRDQIAKYDLHDIVAEGAGPDELLAKIWEVQSRITSSI